MKFIKILLATCISIPLLTSCGGDKQVKEFALQFGNLAQGNKLDSLKLMYPGIEAADSVALKFNPDDIKITEGEKDGVYTINYGNDVSIEVVTEGDGDTAKLQVADSKGLFAWPKDRMEFAKKTGMYKAGLADANLASRMNDTAFIKQLSFDFANELKSNVTVSSWRVLNGNIFGAPLGRYVIARFGCTVKNNTTYEIPGSYYKVNYRIVSRHMGMAYWEDTFSTSSGVFKGKNLKPNGSASYSLEATNISGNPGLMWNVSDEELFNKFFTPKGNEYDDYLKNKKSVEKTNDGKLSGSYTLTGAVGKYPITMEITISGTDVKGRYCYNKNKGSYLNLTGVVSKDNIKLNERNEKGEVSGIFDLTYTIDGNNLTLVGPMTVQFNGKTYQTKLSGKK